MLFSAAGEIDLKMDAVPENVVAFAPTNPGGGQASVTYLGSGAGLFGRLFGYDVTLNGGGATTGETVTLAGAGAVSLIQ